MEIGRISLKSGQLQKGLLQLKRAAIRNPDTSCLHVDLIRAFFQHQKGNEAFSEVKKALCRDPRNYEVYCIVIETFLEREILEDIDSFYQETANMLSYPKSIADLYSGGAKALVRLKKYSKALNMLKKAYETHQMDSDAHFACAEALYREGLFEEAFVQFEHGKRLEPTNRAALNNIAYLHYCLGRLQRAFEEYEHIIENGVELSGTYSNFILVLHHMDKGEKVINRYRDIFQQNIGEDGPELQSMYEEALRITPRILDKDDIDEETR